MSYQKRICIHRGVLLPLAAALSALLVGCGNQGRQIEAGGAAAAGPTGSVRVAIVWPDPSRASARGGRFIPSMTRSIRLRFLRNGSPLLPDRDYSAGSGSTTTDVINGIPVGETLFAATAYPGDPSTGTPLAAGEQTATIEVGVTSPVTIDFNSTIAKVVVAAGGVGWIRVTEQRQFTAEAQDAAGNLVLSPGFVWATSDPAVATVDPNAGLVTGVSNGQVQVTATELDTRMSGSADPSVVATFLGRGSWFTFRQSYMLNGSVGVSGPVALNYGWHSDQIGWSRYGTNTVALGKDVIYCPYYYGLAAIDPTDGHVIWHAEVAGDWVSSPAVARNGTVYLGARDKLFALDPNKPGHVIWTLSSPDGSLWRSPVVADDNNIYVQTDSSLYALSPSGNVLWASEAGAGNNYFGPAVAPGSGKVYAVNGNNSQLCSIKDGVKQWSVRLTTRWTDAGGNAVSVDYSPNTSPTLDKDENIYVGASNKLFKVNPTTGAVIWEYPQNTDELREVAVTSHLAVDVTGSFVAVGARVDPYANESRLLILGADGQLRSWTPLGGDVDWEGPTVDGSGTIYLCAEDGNLYVVGSDGVVRYAFPAHARGCPVLSDDGAFVYALSYDWGGCLYALRDPSRSPAPSRRTP